MGSTRSQPAPQRGDAVAGQAAVGLDLGLARAPRADAADAAPGAEALEVGPQPAHAGEVVLELGELDLELALGAVRVAGEDVEDHRRAVDHRDAERLLEVALLAGRELVVAGDDVRVRSLDGGLELVELARAEVGVRVRQLAVLDQRRPPSRRRRCAGARAAPTARRLMTARRAHYRLHKARWRARSMIGV